MPGVSLVSAEYYRRHLAALGYWFKQVQEVRADRRPAVAARVRFAARCLMRSDCAEVTDGERAEAARLIDASAGFLARHGLTAADARRRLEAATLEPVGRCKKCGAVTYGDRCDKCSAAFLATLERILED